MFEFKGKVLVLTGANGGIGRAIARVFFDLGANLVLADLEEKSLPHSKAQSGSSLEKFAKDLDPQGKRIVFTQTDVTKAGDCDELARFSHDQFGRIDFLVSGAGIYRDQKIETMTDVQWRQTIEVNLNGVFFFCRAMIPHLHDGGAIVNLTSIAAHRGSYHHGHYAAAKGAVLSFTRSLALELAPKIRVNAVSPGLIQTAMIQHRIEEEGGRLVEPTALKRLGQPEEVAKVIAFLCSDWASFITGETVHVNGGLYIAG